MPQCADVKIEFGRKFESFGRRLIEADFSGRNLNSDGGLLLLRQIDQRLGPTRAAAAVSPDPCDPTRINTASKTACVTCWPNAWTACAVAMRI